MVVSIVNKLYTYACRLLTDPKLFWILASLVVLGDAILTELIIKFIPCQSPATSVAVLNVNAIVLADTEIDWNTYMVHIQLYLKGETDYSRLTGPTGPLV